MAAMVGGAVPKLVEAARRGASCARISHWAWLLPMAGIAVLGAAGRPGDTIEAKRFVLRDAKGTERASLAMTESGSVVLQFLDAKGKPALKLLVDGEGYPEVYLTGPDGSQGVSLVCMSDGSSQLFLRSSSGTVSSLTAMGLTGGAGLTMCGKDCKQGITAGVGEGGATLKIGGMGFESPINNVSLGVEGDFSWVSLGRGIGDPKAQIRVHSGGAEPADPPRAVLTLDGVSGVPLSELRPDMPPEVMEGYQSPSIDIEMSGPEGAISISRQGGKEVWRAPQRLGSAGP